MTSLKPMLIVLSLVMLSACTGAAHIESQNRLESGVATLFAAEQQELDAARRQGTAKAGPPFSLKGGDGLFPTAFEAREMLAGDAKADVDSVTDIFSDADRLDRISALYRAGLKVWHSGEAGEKLAPGIAADGNAACQTSPRPDRDCALFDLVVPLVLAEKAVDRLLDQRLSRLRRGGAKFDKNEVNGLLESVEALKQALVGTSLGADISTKGLANFQTGKSDHMKRFVDRQMLIYWCYAAVARAGVGGSMGLGAPEKKTIDEDYEAIKAGLVSREMGKTEDFSDPVENCRRMASDLANAEAGRPGLGGTLARIF